MTVVWKVLSFLLTMIILIIGACGCMSDNSNNINFIEKNNMTDSNASNANESRPYMSTKNRMIDYMNNKYSDDSFTFSGASGGDIGSSDTKIYVESEKHPDSSILVLLTKIDGKEGYSDNYTYFKYNEQTQNLLKEILAEVFNCDFKFSYGIAPAVGYKSLPGDTTFEQYISSELSLIDFTAVVSPEFLLDSKKAFEESLLSAFEKRSMRIFDALILFPGETDGYYEAKDSELSKYIKNHSKVTRFSALSIGSENVKTSWR